MDYILGEAIDQAKAGCGVLDVNVGLPDIDEPETLARVVTEIQAVTDTTLQIDSADPAAIEKAVRAYNGKPVINSVNGKAESLFTILPIAKKYGALVVALTLNEDGIPPTAEGRLAIARKIIAMAECEGIPREDILIDCLVLTASAQQEQVMETIRAIRMVKSELGVKTVLGVSNVSFGLPAREKLNAAFLATAFGAGLDAPILNPLSAKYREVVDCFKVLTGEDKSAANFVALYGQDAPPASEKAERDLREIIRDGRKDEAAPKVRAMLETMPPLNIVNQYFVQALDEVGADYESGKIFLPQLMLAADTVQQGFEVVRDHMAKSGETRESRGRILLATVQGDIHDIGKNIVKMILENYGYDIIDLGKDVPVQAVVNAIRDNDIKLAGLSALMTTTVAAMKGTIAAVRSAGLACSFMVGGAVMNPEYAKLVGAEYYAKDAMDSVAIAGEFFAQSSRP
jgi:5-methyltetrahydrofolate--homocysteine methyltransferase